MPKIFEYGVTVAQDGLDANQHVNNIEYLRWMQSAAIAHSSAQGWSPEQYRQHGVAWVARSLKIEYLVPAFCGDELIVLTWVAGMKKASSLRCYEIVRPRDDVVLAQAETNWVFVKLDGFRPTRIPARIQTAFEIVQR